MKKAFKKYIASVCTPDEFSKISGFITDKSNEWDISLWMDEIMKEEIDKSDATIQRSNPVLLNRIMQAIELQEGRAAKKILKFYSRGLRIAAIMIIGILIASIFYLPRDYTPDPEYTEIMTPAGEKSKIILPDSTIVWLNSESVLKYPANYNREVFLSGEGYFNVKSDKDSKKFTVNTEILNVIVYGTSFNVKNYPDEQIQEVIVAEGEVGIYSGRKQLQLLKENNQAVLGRYTNKISYSECDADLLTSWRKNELIFDDAPVEEIIKSLERWYGVEITIDHNINELPHLTFRVKTESLREVLEMMKEIVPVLYKVNGKEVTITYLNH
jgi:transmembrane sensor